jgi:hypothetical protein
MVDKVQIDRDFRLFFRTLGKWHIDDSGVIDVTGDVEARDDVPGPDLPVQFGTVSGNFDLFQQSHLINLQGAPHTVGGEFFVIANKMTHLTGAPRTVVDRCVLRSMSLVSLEHLPDAVKVLRINITYNLPLLRLTEKSYPIAWGYPASGEGATNPKLRTATEIINKYIGTGKAGAIKAAAELVRADCKANARW